MREYKIAKLINELTKKAIAQKDILTMRQALGDIVEHHVRQENRVMFVFEGERTTVRANWIPNK